MGGIFSHLNEAPTFSRPVYTDVVSFALDDRPVDYDSQRPLYVDAENPSRAINSRQLRLLVRSLISGLRHGADVRDGDCVLVYLPNNVGYLFLWMHFFNLTHSRCSTPPCFSVLLVQAGSIWESIRLVNMQS